MDWNFYSICEAFTLLQMWPVFDVVHYILMALNMKRELSTSVAFAFERRHPLASWITTMLLCNAGPILVCLYLGKPLAIILKSPEKIAVSTLVWYAVNYVPGVFTLLTNRWITCLLVSAKEVQRVYGVYGGVQEASQLYSSYYVVLFTLGFIRGTASEIMMVFARLLAGIIKVHTAQTVSPNVFLFPSCLFKASALVSAMFCLEHYSYIQVNHSVLFSCTIAVLIYLRILMILGVIADPFVPFENLFCAIVFGGMWDAYKLVVRQDRKGTQANGAVHHQKMKTS
ncbi:trimeric intracellular cation channel type 1B.1-like [Watersipora subatra]|uniref:trimeric intracellular cation channel type 1B.1-like n=1 Tax=Watersipora subatra TaxID=2589382 RepID=UPI00355BA1F2